MFKKKSTIIKPEVSVWSHYGGGYHLRSNCNGYFSGDDLQYYWCEWYQYRQGDKKEWATLYNKDETSELIRVWQDKNEAIAFALAEESKMIAFYERQLARTEEETRKANFVSQKVWRK